MVAGLEVGGDRWKSKTLWSLCCLLWNGKLLWHWKRGALITIVKWFTRWCQQLKKDWRCWLEKLSGLDRYTVRSYSNPRIYDIFAEELVSCVVHHIMAFTILRSTRRKPGLLFRSCLWWWMTLDMFGWIFRKSQKKCITISLWRLSLNY